LEKRNRSGKNGANDPDVSRPAARRPPKREIGIVMFVWADPEFWIVLRFWGSVGRSRTEGPASSL
jgi:hypothetical protein